MQTKAKIKAKARKETIPVTDDNANHLHSGSADANQASASGPENEQRGEIAIWVDADACPIAVKEIIFRTAKRLKILTTFIANQTIRVPAVEFIQSVTVSYGADVADHEIVKRCQADDLVITNDIPLAARVVAKGATAIGMRGQLFDESSVHSRLASRNLMEQLRAAGMETRGPKPIANKDVQAFANQLDRMLTKLHRNDSKFPADRQSLLASTQSDLTDLPLASQLHPHARYVLCIAQKSVQRVGS